MKIYLLDNFDSFTYNLVDQFRSLGFEVVIYRNDLSADFIAEKLLNEADKATLVLSPGPGAPHEAGCLMALIAKLAGKVPMLGICLGHQAMVEHYGGKVERAPQVVHGKASPTFHEGVGIFAVHSRAVITYLNANRLFFPPTTRGNFTPVSSHLHPMLNRIFKKRL